MKNRQPVAIVTGSSKGIGAATAIALARAGFNITLTGRNLVDLNRVEALVKQANVNALVINEDLSRDQGPKDLVFRSYEHWGRLDVLVNNAAVGMESSLLSGNSMDWLEMLRVNVLAVAAATQAAIPMFPAAGGNVVIVSSTSAHRVLRSTGFYPATKFALRGYILALRQELHMIGNSTRVSEVAPGRTDTSFMGNSNDGAANQLTAEDVALAIERIITMPMSCGHQDMTIFPKGKPV